MIPAFVITVLGWRIARVCAFPLFYLFFAVPFGEFLIYPMMRATTIMSAAMLRGIGVPLHVEGVEIFLLTTTWNVAEGCSGLRYLIASTALGTAYAYFFYRSIFRRVIFVIASIVLPLLANWLRVFILVWLGHISGGKLSTGYDHIIYGWVLFALVILILFLVGMYWREDSEEDTLHGKGVNVASTAFSNWTVNVFVGLALGVIAIGPFWAQSVLQPNETSGNWRLEPPAAHGFWQPSELQMTDWRPIFVNADDELFSTYVNGDKMVGLYIAYYRQQTQGKEVVSSSNRMIEDNKRVWSRGLQKYTTIKLDNTSLKARMTLLKARRDNRCLQTTDWYWVEGRNTSNWLVAKGIEVFDKLLGGRGSGAGIVVVADCAEGKEAPEATSTAFLSEMLPSIEASIENVQRR
jgi:EpsI family protein